MSKTKTKTKTQPKPTKDKGKMPSAALAPPAEQQAPDPVAAAMAGTTNGDGPDAPEPQPPAEAQRPEAAPADQVRYITIELPLGEILKDGGYRSRGLRDKHCEARLDCRQAETLRQLFDGLDAMGARLQSGKRIGSNADVVRWILEAVAEGEGARD